MPILFTCPHCGVQTNVADPSVGQTVPCAACGKEVTIPSVGAPPKKSRVGCIIAVLVGVVVIMMCAGLLSAMWEAREAARRSQCQCRLKQITLAMQNYHEVYGCLPAPYTADASGRPLLSWRVAVLPFFERRDLYKQFRQDETWGSPHNQVLAKTPLSYFHCPSDASQLPDSTEANYGLVTGPGGLFPDPSKPRTFKEIPDGPSNTILAVETVGLGIPWAAPRDITVEEFLDRFRKTQESGRGELSRHSGGIFIAMCDGSIRFLPYATPIETVRALLTPDGGEKIPELDF